MKKGVRTSPPICLIIALARLISGKLKLSKKQVGQTITMEHENHFNIFRHIQQYPACTYLGCCVFIVQFKFAKLSFKGNKMTSVIPMLLIAGFPGFQQKIYAVNERNGFWQGLYQWKSKEYLEAYKKSFVFRVMNKRAVPGSVNSFEILNYSLDEFLKASEFKDNRKSKIS